MSCSAGIFRFLYSRPNSLSVNSFAPKNYGLHTSVLSYSFNQQVPKSSEEVKKILSRPLDPISPPDSKLLRVAIIGVPNSGKSTLINNLTGIQVCSVSQKVHTTQYNARAISNEGSTQIIYLDTPGVITPEEGRKYKVKQSLLMDPELSLQQADLIAVLHDVSNKYTRYALDPRILRLLFLYPSIPSVLLLNKEDKLKNKTLLLALTNLLTVNYRNKTPANKKMKRKLSDEELRQLLLQQAETEDQKLSQNNNYEDEVPVESEAFYVSDSTDLDTIERTDEIDHRVTAGEATYDISDHSKVTLEEVLSGEIIPTERQVQELVKKSKGWPNFQEVFMISALNGSGLRELKNYFLRSARKNKWMFSGDMVTDQNPQELAVMAVRGKCLKYLTHNIPYELKYKVLHWDLSEADVLSITIAVYYKKKIHSKIFFSRSGTGVKKIAMEAEQDLRNLFRTEVILKIHLEMLPKQ